MRNGRVSVFVADDHPVYRDGVVLALRERPEFVVVGTADDGREALDALRRLEPDVAILDVRMPGLDGHAVLHALRRERLTTRVVLVSATVEVEAADAARAAGACAYVSKASSHEAICAAVAGAAGGRPAPSDASRPERGPARFERPLLSPRELEVLRLVAEGRSGPEIGRALHLSPETIKTHLKSAYEKLGVSERAAAVAEGMRRGVLE